MPWPSITDFTNAVQNPQICFAGNPELAQAEIASGRLGQPLVWSGQFASVYQARLGNRAVAVRCFTHEVRDQQKRYGLLHDFLDAVLPESFVRFRYLEQGIRVNGQWYPVVRMDWADGQALNHFVRDNLENGEAIAEIAARWRGAVNALNGLKIAHNDLQHGNVIVSGDLRLRLVDYDGIFLPSFRGQSSPELGHLNYQHPRRSASNYDERIDNFPALAIYLSLLAIKADPGLWDKFYNDDNLLLTREDYANPDRSACLTALKQSPDEVVRKLAAKLEGYCSLPVEQTPDLETVLNGGTVPPPPPSPPLVKCRSCGRNNDRGLIYCVNQACIAPLAPSSLRCFCQVYIPANARHCPHCGRRQGQRTPQPVSAAARSAQPRATLRQPAPARTRCPNCHSPLQAAARFCRRCGTAAP